MSLCSMYVIVPITNMFEAMYPWLTYSHGVFHFAYNAFGDINVRMVGLG